MEKEIKITPPEGYEIDKENSTFDCIKFKPVVKRWRDKDAKINGYSIVAPANPPVIVNVHSYFNNDCSYATKKQAKSALAMAHISQIMANDERFGGVVTDEEWHIRTTKYVIERHCNSIHLDSSVVSYAFLAFHTREQRDLFLKENEDLIKDFLMI